MKKIIETVILLQFLIYAGCSDEAMITRRNPPPTRKITLDDYNKPEIYDDVKLTNLLKISFAMGNVSRTMTYQKSEPLTLPNGTVINQGDLKANWQYIEKELGFRIEDVVDPQKERASSMISSANSQGFSNAIIYGGNSIANSLMTYGTQGAFINLLDYLEYMPHVTRYLDNNPSIAKAITAYDGGIYHLPYVAEVSNYARVLNGRADWIRTLLDSTTGLIDEDETLTISYEGYWDRYDQNIISLQNSTADNGVLSRDIILDVLKRYIKITYPELKQPSDLYIGKTAKFDIDELVALWRVVKLSPNTLSKQTTGRVVTDAVITPYFLRKTSYTAEIFRLLNFFDGEKVHSTDSSATGAITYIDDRGEMNVSYASDSFLSKVDYLRQIYSEGLIYSGFNNTSDKTDLRKKLFFSDAVEGSREFGFMTIDWIASTTAGSSKVECFLPPMTRISKAGITEFIHYIENTRAIKGDGWSISAAASEEERNAALMLFDYMFSDMGRAIQNYSTPDLWVEGEFEKSPDGKLYPVFNSWAKESATEFANGSVATFLRDWMGAQLPLGYQKELGVELQFTNENGQDGWELYSEMNVLTMTYDSPITYLRLMPPVISFTPDDIKDLKKSAIGTRQRAAILDYITGGSSIKSLSEVKALYEEKGLENYKEVYKRAYNRMMLVN